MFDTTRLRVRTDHRHRQGRAAHSGGEGARTRLRLHDLQRRLGARLPAQDDAMARGQELRRHGAARARGGYGGRIARGRHALADPDARQRQEHAGFQHLRHDLLGCQDGRTAVGDHDAGARRSHRHGHAAGRGARAQAAGLDEGRRRRRDRDRGHRRALEPDPRRGVGGAPLRATRLRQVDRALGPSDQGLGPQRRRSCGHEHERRHRRDEQVMHW